MLAGLLARLILANFFSHSQKREKFFPQKFIPFSHTCFTSTLHKICQNTGFLQIKTKSMILSLYEKIQVRENQYTGIFCVMLYYHNFYVFALYTTQKVMLSIKNFFSECKTNLQILTDLFTFTTKFVRESITICEVVSNRHLLCIIHILLKYVLFLIIDLPAFFADGTF